MQIGGVLTEEKASQVRGPHLDVLRLHRDRELQSAVAPRIFRVMRCYLAQMKALDELYKLSTTNYALVPKLKSRIFFYPNNQYIRYIPLNHLGFHFRYLYGKMANFNNA